MLSCKTFDNSQIHTYILALLSPNIFEVTFRSLLTLYYLLREHDCLIDSTEYLCYSGSFRPDVAWQWQSIPTEIEQKSIILFVPPWYLETEYKLECDFIKCLTSIMSLKLRHDTKYKDFLIQKFPKSSYFVTKIVLTYFEKKLF